MPKVDGYGNPVKKEDVLSVTLKKPMSKKDKEILAKQEPGKVVVLGATPESSKLKLKMLSKKPKKAKKEKLPEHIRKAYITINDKKPNNPIAVSFSGEWTGSDINLAGKHLILEYNVYVRNRAIRGK